VKYKPRKAVVRAAARGGRSFPNRYDDLDLDLAHAHLEAGVEAMLRDNTAFARAAKAAGSPELARSVVTAFFGVEP
jgi:hypothetical protein